MPIDKHLISNIPKIQAGINFIAKHSSLNPYITAVYIFGSVAEGRETEDSDIDLAILTDNRDALRKDFMWWAKLGLQCPTDLDYLFEESEDDFRQLKNWDKAVKIYERQSEDSPRGFRIS